MKTKNNNLDYPTGKNILIMLAAVLILGPATRPLAGLTRIRDIARPLGERTNKLIGYGLVVGLKGTGDSGDDLMAMRPLREMLEKLGNPTDIQELTNVKNCANVIVTAELGRNGVREGDKIDVFVHSMGSAKSLEGGTLLLTPLRGSHYQDDRVYGVAQGAITILDTKYPTSGVVKGGVDIEEDIFHLFVDYDAYPDKAVFTLVLDNDQANWQTAKTIADIINEEVSPPDSYQMGASAGVSSVAEPAAITLGPKNIQVSIPDKQARYPSSFIARVMNLPLDLPDPEAAVVINEKTGVIAITGNVEIAPIVVHVNGLSIRIVEPQPQPQPQQPAIKQSEWSQFDTGGSNQPKLKQLIDALDLLNVPVQDKINVIYEINRVGALRANLISGR
jgi:flagellar P-ring protein precursor FlgI